MANTHISVIGATGQQGGSVAKALIRTGKSLRALTRNPDSPAARLLQGEGAEIRRFDFSDSDGMEAALAGTAALFLVTTPFEAGTDAETSQGIAAVDAAKRAGVPYIVFSSVAGADKKTGIPHFESKYRVEEHLAGSGIPHTVIAPVYFYENIAAPFVLPGLKEGVFAQALTENRPLQMISHRTIGELAALALTAPDSFSGKRLDIAGDELTGPEIASILSEASSRTISFNQLPLDMVMQQSEDMGLMYQWFEEVGYSADINGLAAEFPEVDWIGFRDWAGSVDWADLLA